MPIVLLDTNVWVSAFINPHGAPARVVAAWLAARFDVALSLPLLEELTDVLMRPRLAAKYRISAQDVQTFLELLQARARMARPTGDLRLCRDPDDDWVLETAILSRAQYLVTRDDDIKSDSDLVAQLQAQGVTVLTVQHFLDWLHRLE